MRQIYDRYLGPKWSQRARFHETWQDIDTIEDEGLLANVREREAQIRDRCMTGPVVNIQGKGLLLGLVCDRPATEVRDALLDQDILTGTSADPKVLRILAPLVIDEEHVDHFARALARIPGGNT
jgi:acetylornithine/succinyldiaminopimelate/putrescine aminotransferase